MNEDPKPDWEAIAWQLGKEVVMALEFLKPKHGGSGVFQRDGKRKHWREMFADSLELLPGTTVDREACHALDLPRKERDKFFKERDQQKEEVK